MDPGYENLINSLIKDGYLKTPEIIEAFKAIDRADFVPEEYKSEAYVNAPLPIGFNQTISQPLTVAFMIELLEPKAGDKILDVGSGSGWTPALLAHITSGGKSSEVGLPNIEDTEGKEALVFSLERIPELKEFAEKNIAKYGFVEKGIVKIIHADGSKGYKKEAPYDKIIAGAASEADIPEAWKRQLKIGGRIVSPVGQSIIVLDKISKKDYNQKEYFGFSFVPLVRD